jgi:uncharacterized protein YjbI with pentapeptide repeats
MLSNDVKMRWAPILNLQKLNFRSPVVLMVLGVAAILILALIVVLWLSQTGGAKAVSDNAALIGALVALGGVFTAQMVSIALEDRRANEAALRNYLEDVGKLLIEKSLHQASRGDNLSTVVRAQTLSLLEDLDPDRKRILLLFLSEAGLIRTDKPKEDFLRVARYRRTEKPIVELSGGDLSGADLRKAVLHWVVLSEANLARADLRKAKLNNAALVRADLSSADLSEAKFSNASLVWADLSGADLREAVFSRADLRAAVLRDVDLSGARLSKANLSRADLSGAKLSEASLNEANLSNIRGVTGEELEQQAASLEEATMPNGQKYEDWRKDIEGRKEDAENGSPS